ncbi:MAG TPA: hypothetical protein VI248_23180 [Kineosporiaceae bacterium]
MPTTDQAGLEELVSRVHDWLVSLWTDPQAAAQFAENPAVSLASNNLNQEALNQVNLRHIAGDVANTPGLPAGGRAVLDSFAHSPASHSSTQVREVFHVTREVHHDNPVIQRIFQDNSVHIDNSQTFVNHGIVDGNVSLDNNSATAIGHGAVAGAGGATVNAATGAGSVANQGSGDVNQASGHGQVISGSDVGQNTNHSPGSVQVGGNADGAVNTGAVHGTQAGGGATGNVTGDGNETASVGASSGHDGGGHADGSAIAFGHGSAGAASGNTVGGDAALSGAGGAQNQSHAGADHGSAIGGHDAGGSTVTDASTHVSTHNDTLVDHSHNVDLAQDHSGAESDQHLKPVHVDVDHSALAGGDIDHTNVLHS